MKYQPMKNWILLFAFLFITQTIFAQHTAYILRNGSFVYGKIVQQLDDGGVVLEIENGSRIELSANTIVREAKRWRKMERLGENRWARTSGGYTSIEVGVQHTYKHNESQFFGFREILPHAFLSTGRQLGKEVAVGLGVGYYVTDGWRVPIYGELMLIPSVGEVNPMLRVRTGVSIPGEPEFQDPGFYSDFSLGIQLLSNQGIALTPYIAYAYSQDPYDRKRLGFGPRRVDQRDSQSVLVGLIVKI